MQMYRAEEPCNFWVQDLLVPKSLNDVLNGVTSVAMVTHTLEDMLLCSKPSQHHHQKKNPQQQQERKVRPQPEQSLKCPRCDSNNTKFLTCVFVSVSSLVVVALVRVGVRLCDWLVNCGCNNAESCL
ncbi:Dof zinc finger protein PBF [Acorus calamus]|uniref:Dof zinc finger protein PBF n=1 Tax=Acorus calamus TaxID=4465 RepID=A0AAV9EZK8_ACOCL|nr:Dof zinc finger protein PBF [Acorus calamus]